MLLNLERSGIDEKTSCFDFSFAYALRLRGFGRTGSGTAVITDS